MGGSKMPDRYEAMRDEFKKKGLSSKAAKTKAAKIYNATKKPGEPSLHHGKRKVYDPMK
jgi:hypothetical protein